MNTLFFLIGASGSGKTTVAKILEKKSKKTKVCYFDSIGVPSTQKMIEEFGSVDEWQRAKTIEWVKKIKKDFLSSKNIILDAQTRPSFIEEACKKASIGSYKIILFDCKDSIRKDRLKKRGQLELANKTMMNWARYLRKECLLNNCKIIDNSRMTIGQNASELLKIVKG